VLSLTPSSCPAPSETACTPARCRERCALEVIDELLSAAHYVTGEEADLLLDLRWQLRRGSDAEGTLRLFCDLRVRMEQRHYLAFFRLRRWMENHLVAAIQICPAAEPHRVAVKLNHYCVEAIRRVCLCTAISSGTVLLAPRLRFAFHEVPPHVRLDARDLAESAA
jgi:hypothetical protein